MSILLDRLNTIRTVRGPAWLTPSQRLAGEQTAKLARFSLTVNLFGSAGSGKTFLAWFLAEQLAYHYLALPTRLHEEEGLAPHASGIIVDNCSSNRIANREILKELSLRGMVRAILISQKPIEDYGYRVQIQCTKDDISHARRNLATAHILPLAQDAHDLWNLVNQFY